MQWQPVGDYDCGLLLSPTRKEILVQPENRSYLLHKRTWGHYFLSAMAKKLNGDWDYYNCGGSRGEAWGSPLILDQTDA